MAGTSGSRNPLYESAEWRELRRLVRRRDPRCTGPCGGANSTRYVDHIVPVKDGGAPLDPENCQGLCDPCHRLKSRQEQGERGELKGGKCRQRKALVLGVDPKTGIPLDPDHFWNKP